jgi:hypothetical protein
VKADGSNGGGAAGSGPWHTSWAASGRADEGLHAFRGAADAIAPISTSCVVAGAIAALWTCAVAPSSGRSTVASRLTVPPLVRAAASPGVSMEPPHGALEPPS